MTDESFSREELEALSHGARPTKGELCLKCGSYIPQFEDINKEDDDRLQRLRETRDTRAISELIRLTGCPVSFAKIWWLHPHGSAHEDRSTPCPFCGQPLRTSEAKQCRYCKRDWHDPDNITSLFG
jgi:hypothetical protein